MAVQNYARYCVREEEYSREVLDAHTDETLGDCDGVLRYKLLEGDEEAGLDSNTTRNGGVTVVCQYCRPTTAK
jgi:hypothetical protein